MLSFGEDLPRVAIMTSAAGDFSKHDEKLTSRDKALRVEHERVIEIVRVDSLLGFRQLVAELGGDAEALLRESDIEPRALDSEDHYVSFRNFMLLFERTASALDCPDFGMRLAARLNPDILGPLAVAIQNAETARASLTCARRFMHFHNTALVLGLEPAAVAGCELVSIDLAMRRRPRGVQVLE